MQPHTHTHTHSVRCAQQQGAETEHPILRIGDDIFYEGRYIDTLGTDLVFEMPEDEEQPQDMAECCVAQSSKRLVFSKVTLQPRDAHAPATSDAGGRQENKSE